MAALHKIGRRDNLVASGNQYRKATIMLFIFLKIIGIVFGVDCLGLANTVFFSGSEAEANNWLFDRLMAVLAISFGVFFLFVAICGAVVDYEVLFQVSTALVSAYFIVMECSSWAVWVFLLASSFVKE